MQLLTQFNMVSLRMQIMSPAAMLCCTVFTIRISRLRIPMHYFNIEHHSVIFHVEKRWKTLFVGMAQVQGWISCSNTVLPYNSQTVMDIRECPVNLEITSHDNHVWCVLTKSVHLRDPFDKDSLCLFQV